MTSLALLSSISAWFAPVTALLEPVSHLSDPTRRLFVPFLLSAAVLAWGVAFVRGASAIRAAKTLVEPRLWWHRSARADYQLVALKAVLRAATAGFAGFSALVLAGLSANWLRVTFGSPSLRAPVAVVALLFTLVAFVAEDFSRFFLHWLMHKVPALWAFHRVHHSAEVLTPITLYRTHPVESALNRARGAITMGLVTGLFVWLFGTAVRGWELFSVDALGFIWSMCGANLRHSHVWLSFGPRVERWLLSPAQHQVHHSTATRHLDKNFGTILSVWDRLFRSLYTTTSAPERLRFGLHGDRQPQSGLALVLEPFAWLLGADRRASIGARARKLGVRTVAAASALMVAGCLPLQAPYDRAGLLEATVACSVDLHTQFRASMQALLAAARAYEAAPTDSNRDAARAAFTAAFDLWQQEEMLRFGPSADRTVAGGQDLRTQIYSWPDSNRCLIEEQIATQGYAAPTFATSAPTVRTLAAIEFLLFSTDSNNICPPDHAINAMGAWQAMSASELVARKAAYTRVVAEQVDASAAQLIAAWSGASGYGTMVSSAGRGVTATALFETQSSALNAVVDGPFHLDSETKDTRVGTPLGVFNCEEESCLGAIESPYANRSRINVRNNLRGARRILFGCSAGGDRGFDDMLEGVGAGPIAEQLRAKYAAAEQAVDAISNDSLAPAIEGDRARVLAAHTAIRELTSFMKAEFATTLALSSRRVEGDTD